MKILVTGSTGFVGQHFIRSLLSDDHEVIAVSRNELSAQACDWYDKVEYRTFDLHNVAEEPRHAFQGVDAVAHLAWGDLTNFRSLTHFQNELPAAYTFLSSIIRGGCRNILVAGTCLEYGLQFGGLSESLLPQPVTAYGLAKSSLHQFLCQLQTEVPFDLTWARLFYTYGQGQSEKSLLPLLRSAVDRGDTSFAMSGGEQIRDFISIEETALQLKTLLVDSPGMGAINICSGQPISVRNMVERQLNAWGKTIDLELGAYPYPDYEPLAFWGDNRKYQAIRDNS